MKGKRKRLIAAVALIAALAAGGVAFTDSLAFDPGAKQNIGYGSVTVTGGETVSNVQYGFNSDGSQVTGVTLTFLAAPTNKYVKVAFDQTAGNIQSGSGTILSNLNNATCIDGTSGVAAITSTGVVCTFATPVDANAAKSLEVLVTDHPVDATDYETP